MDMQYNYTAGQNNGRIASSQDYISGETVQYAYDGLLRLAVFLRAGEGTDVRSMQIQIIDHEFPRFSHRFERDDVRSNNHSMLLPWVPVSRTDGSTS